MDQEAGGHGPAAQRTRHARGKGPVVKAEGVRACAERTLNMDLMSVTLDVLKLSGWLNADAPYRVGRRAYDAGQGIWSRGGGHGPAAAHARHALGTARL